jgi:hypothetical protein
MRSDDLLNEIYVGKVLAIGVILGIGRVRRAFERGFSADGRRRVPAR